MPRHSDAALAADSPESADAALADDAAPVPVVLKRPRAPRARPMTAEKRLRAADGAAFACVATPAVTASAATPMDGVAPHTAPIGIADNDGARVHAAAPAAVAAAATVPLAAPLCAGCVDTTPTTVLCAHDALASPDASTPQAGAHHGAAAALCSV
jgi:hypothetical protein